MLSVSLIRCKNEALKKLQLKSKKKNENMQVTRNTILISPHIDCCVRINGLPDRLFSGDIQ